MWGINLGSPRSERLGGGNRLVAVRMRFSSPAFSHRGRSCVSEGPPELPKAGQLYQSDWGPEGRTTYVGLKTGGEMPHSGTLTAGPKSAAGGNSEPQLA